MVIGIFTENISTFENFQLYLEHAGHEVVWLNPYQMPQSIKVEKAIIDPDTDRPIDTPESFELMVELATEGDAVFYTFRPELGNRRLKGVTIPTVDKRAVGEDIPLLLAKLGIGTE